MDFLGFVIGHLPNERGRSPETPGVTVDCRSAWCASLVRLAPANVATAPLPEKPDVRSAGKNDRNRPIKQQAADWDAGDQGSHSIKLIEEIG
jgi:hypothetical protein